MAHENETNQAESGTTKQNGCPAWDNIGQGQLPFFNPTEEKKRAGIRVKFMTDGPRKETVNQYDPKNPKPELWFDVELTIFDFKTNQNVITKMTWTISQISLLQALKTNTPLKDKVFDIKLIPVDQEFKDQNPKYKGKDRYEVKEVKRAEAIIDNTDPFEIDPSQL